MRKDVSDNVEVTRLPNGMFGDPGHGGTGIQHFLGEHRRSANRPGGRVIFHDGFVAVAGDAAIHVFKGYAVRQHREMKEAERAIDHRRLVVRRP